MKKDSLYGLLALVIAIFVVCACSTHGDDSQTYTSDCDITSFTLGKMKRTIHTTSSTGDDSTYTITFSGSLYALTINQVRHEITNIEHLPLGTELRALATITANGYVVYAPETDVLAKGDSATWVPYSSGDSIDFSAPLIFRAWAYDGSSYSQYRMTLNVRTDAPGEYTWRQLTGIPSLAARAEARLLLFGNEAVVLSTSTEGNMYCVQSSSTVNPEWANEQECAGLPTTANVRSTVCYQDQLWMNTADGKLFRTADGVNWTEVAQEDEIVGVHLMAASATALHAVIQDKRLNTPYYMASSTDGSTWTAVAMEQMFFELPSAALAYTQTNGNHRVLLCGDVPGSDTEFLNLWSLLEDKDEQWMLITDDNASVHQLPRWQQPLLLAYNGWLVALGDADKGGTHTTLDALYVSADNGLNWYTDDALKAPEALVGTDKPITATAVGEYIWLMAGDQLWRVRYNDYGQ